jgi:hypothetical protein
MHVNISPKYLELLQLTKVLLSRPPGNLGKAETELPWLMNASKYFQASIHRQYDTHLNTGGPLVLASHRNAILPGHADRID